MCSPTPCQECGKVTWKGCGEHVDSVRAQVEAKDWCEGHDTATTPAKNPA